MVWKATREQLFEMPSGGTAKMRRGINVLKQARKEQCICMASRLQRSFKVNSSIFKVVAEGGGEKVEHLHPIDGVYPEKLRGGRRGVNQNMWRIA
jgi:photosystem I subunit 2